MQSTKGRDARVEMSRWVCRGVLNGRMVGVILEGTRCCVLMALRVGAVVDCCLIAQITLLLRLWMIKVSLRFVA